MFFTSVEDLLLLLLLAMN